MTTEEIKNEISIVEYAERMGFHTKKVGRYYTLAEHDSVRIDPNQNIFFRNSTGQSGSVIDFVSIFGGVSIADAIKELSRYGGKTQGTINQEAYKKPLKTENIASNSLELPERAGNNKNVFAYLIKTRKIDKDIVQELVHRKMIYQDKKNNCVFVSYKDDKPAFACFRGTNTYHRFLGDVAGSDYSHCFFIDNNSKQLVITEGVIDALSVATLYKGTKNLHKAYDYLALSGVSKYEKALDNYLKRDYETITLCLDSDEAGREAAVKIEEYINRESPDTEVYIEPPESGKDYNELLQNLAKENEERDLHEEHNNNLKAAVLNVHNSFAKIGAESKLHPGTTYNMIMLPPGTIIDGQDVSGSRIYPLEKYTYSNPMNKNLTSVSLQLEQDVKLFLKDGSSKDVVAEDLCAAVDAANKKYLALKTKKPRQGREREDKEIEMER